MTEVYVRWDDDESDGWVIERGELDIRVATPDKTYHYVADIEWSE